MAEDQTSGLVAKWGLYQCGSCGGAVLAKSNPHPNNVNGIVNVTIFNDLPIQDVFPKEISVELELPERARRYLQQALDTIHSPDACVMVAASAVDAMLKEKGLEKGSLYDRIEQAKSNGLITVDMATWAHQVRLDANDPRHADLNDPHHDEASAHRAVDFVRALGEFLFVLPQRVTRGLREAKRKE